jgi:Protein of unknown function (DUF3995)
MLAPLTAAVFGFLALLHFYWAWRGVSGNNAAIPQVNGAPAFKPSKTATAAVGLVLLGTAAIVLMDVTLLVAAAAAVMILRAIGDFRLVGFFKRVRGSRFARMDTLLYSPLCLALGAALALQAAG